MYYFFSILRFFFNNIFVNNVKNDKCNLDEKYRVRYFFKINFYLYSFRDD